MRDKLNTTSTAEEINRVHMPTIAVVLRTLLLDHKIKPYELATALNMPPQTVHQLLHKSAIYPKVSTLIPIAKFFNITIGQLVGDEPLDAEKKTEKEELEEPGVWNHNLYMQCAERVIKLFAKYKVTPNDKLALKLIRDIYKYSLRDNKSSLDETFADWYISQYSTELDYK